METTNVSLLRHRKATAVALLLITSTALVGCGKSETRVATFPVEGSVRFEGQATPGALVILHPQGALPPGTPTPKAKVNPDGSFKLTTFSSGDGAPVGDYRVTIAWRPRVERNGELELGSNVLPKAYSAVATTPLKIQVAAAPNQLDTIVLQR